MSSGAARSWFIACLCKVGRPVKEKLREKNVNVRFIAGGLEAWKKSGSR
jgi:hypothetical protein